MCCCGTYPNKEEYLSASQLAFWVFGKGDPSNTTKLANVMTTVELARRLASRRIAVNALHPGVAPTRLLVQGLGATQGWDTCADAARTTVWLAHADETRRFSGGYYDGRGMAPMNPAARDTELVDSFYRASLGFTGAMAA